METPSLQEIEAQQGTRLRKENPWDSYSASFTEKLDPKLEAEVKEYSQRRHDKSSSQNKEELHKQKEINEELGKQYQWLHPSEYIDAGPRIGKILSHAEFIKILRKSGLECWYVQHPHLDKLTLLVLDKMSHKPEFAAWAAYGYMPEYSIMNFDRYGVPLAERYRGWRTVLLQLILQGLISEERADKFFGKAHGPASGRFLKTCYGIRNTMKR